MSGGAREFPRRLRARWRVWRNARIADPAFQHWVAGFWPTRGVARGQAEELYDIVSGFVYSQVLYACVELDLFRRLERHPLSGTELAETLHLAPDRAARLAQAAASLRLLERVGDRYGLGPLGAAMLGAPGVAEMVRHHALFYRDLIDPVALLRDETDTELARFWGYVGGTTTHAMSAEAAAPYSTLMAASQAMVAEETLAAVPLRGVRRLLDVGGGEGAFIQAALAAEPQLRATLFDLPAVVARGQSRLAEANLSDRVSFVGGSFLDDPLPEGADAASLVRVLYDHDDPVVQRLLEKVSAALPAGGLLLISEPMSGGRRPSRSGDAYFGFYTLAMTTGCPRSPRRHAELLAAAGFERIRWHATRQRFVTSVVTARRA